MDLDETIKNRKSVKKFSDKKPDWRDIIDCIDSARYSPKAGNNFVMKFILVDDKEKINKISEATQQKFVSETDYVLVACSNPTRLKSAFGDEGEIYSRQQAGAAIQNFLLKIQEKGLATCWIGYFVEQKIKDILKIPEKFEIEAVFPIGYASSQIKGKSKRKIDLDRFLYFNQYGNMKMKNPRKLDV